MWWVWILENVCKMPSSVRSASIISRYDATSALYRMIVATLSAVGRFFRYRSAPIFITRRICRFKTICNWPGLVFNRFLVVRYWVRNGLYSYKNFVKFDIIEKSKFLLIVKYI